MVAPSRVPPHRRSIAFAAFMATSPGRAARVLAGIALTLVGLDAVGGWWGALVALIGLVPLAAGLLNVCLIAPLLGVPLRGRDLPS